MKVLDTRQEQLRAFVRFSLAQLRTRNDHHRFEHLCTALARQRITANIVVGTGPVSAGGDQGRDFETFLSYGHGHVRDLGGQLGIRDADTIVFCCTVGHQDIGRKVLDDVRKAISFGTDVDVVVYFTEQDVPTAKRHHLIAQAASDYEVRLEVLDGQTLTGLLCDRDTFWIAVEFLDVPVHLAPADAGPEWYASSRARWLTRATSAETSGDLIELTTCVRFATYNKQFRADIPMWLDRLAPLLDESSDSVGRRRARYETAVARYLGLGDLRPADALARSALQDAALSDSVEELGAAVILRQFAYAAWLYAVTGFTAEELDAFGERLEERLVGLVCAATDNTRRCRLLRVLGLVRLRSSARELEASGIERGRGEPPSTMADEEWNDYFASNPVQLIEVPFVVDRTGALTSWREVLDLIDDSPLFPVQDFAESVSMHAAYLHDDPRWADLVAALDQRVAVAAGQLAAAGLARSRSAGLQAAGRPFAALTELHRAREALVAWERQHVGAEALLDAAQVYQTLGLLYAAKHYALAAGAVATLDGDEDQNPLVADSLIMAADCDFTAGNWFSLLTILPMTVAAHATRRVASEDPELWGDFRRLLTEVATVARVSDVMGSPQLTKWVDAQLSAARLDPDEVRSASAPLFGKDATHETVLNTVSGILAQPPFADTGRQRLIQFEARGVTWRIEARNTYDDVRAAERLAAAVQIVVAAMGDDDLVLIETTVHIVVRTIHANPDRTARHKTPRPAGRTPENAIRWTVPLTRDRGPYSVDTASATREVAEAVLAVLVSLSVLPEDSIMSLIRQHVSDSNLIRALFPHIRYDRAYAVLPRRDYAEKQRRGVRTVIDPDIRYGSDLATTHLAPIRRPGPTFRGETPRDRIASRYNAFAKTLRCTVPRLSRDEGFRTVVSDLRTEGWKDWHILMAVANIVLNHQLAIEGADPRDPAVREKWEKNVPEDPSDPMVDPEEMTTDLLRQWLMHSVGATVDAFGLTIRAPFTPEEILHLLATRYEYWDHDSPHDDPFASDG